MTDTQMALPKSAIIPPSDYVVIGGTGDLALRKIFPALFYRYLDGQVSKEFRLVVAARQAVSHQEFADKLRPFCSSAFAEDAAHWSRFHGGIGRT